MRGTPFQAQFEDEFGDVDNRVHDILGRITESRLIGPLAAYFASVAPRLMDSERKLSDLCKTGLIEDAEYRLLLETLVALLLRSPSTRFFLESFSMMVEPDETEDVGKLNMRSRVELAKRVISARVLPNFFFVFMISKGKKFFFGDGLLDAMTPALVGNSLRGHAFIPLKPNLAVYLCTPRRMKTDRNYASFLAPDWMVEEANNITQIYSKEWLFFQGDQPSINESFRSSKFLQWKYHQSPLFDYLNEVANYGSYYRDLRGNIIERV
ncbi:hypothetical protein RAZWK3B_12092 [Roseobacter sp. AzwK-3b]|nr:hypothetical protein RAZWK3B_12092 [Roseobacter sp. AzwK-3b]